MDKHNRTRLMAPWLIGILAVLLYLPSLRNGLVYDDEVLISNETPPAALADYAAVFGKPRHFANLPYYRPLPRLTVLVQKGLHDNRAAPYHLFNILLAGLTAAAAFSLLRRPAFGLPPIPAALAALLFIAHPVASSCVYPATSGRETLLPACLLLLSLNAWLRSGPWNRAAAVLLWILALLSKEQALVFPALLVLADALGLSEDRQARRPARLAAWIAGLGAIAAAYLLLRWRLFGGSELAFAFLDRPFRPLLSYLYALQTLWLPFRTLAYEPPEAVWFAPWRSGAALLLTGLLAAAGWRFRGRIGKPLLFWAAWFVLLQLPTANLLRQEAPFDERFVFLAGLALPAATGALLSLFWIQPAVRRATLAGGLALAAAAAALTLGRAGTFRDDEVFSAAWARSNPASAIARNNLGRALLDKGLLADAEGELLAAKERDPGLAAIRFNLATVHLRQNRADEAIAGFGETLRLKPDYRAHYNLALALDAAGRTAEAEAQYRLVAEDDRDHGNALYNLGLLLGRTGRLEDAAALFRTVMAENRSDPDSAYNLGVTLERMNRLDGAEEAYREAIGRDARRPAVHLNLANLLVRQGRLVEAAAEYEAVLALDPGDTQARLNRDALQKKTVSP